MNVPLHNTTHWLPSVCLSCPLFLVRSFAGGIFNRSYLLADSNISNNSNDNHLHHPHINPALPCPTTPFAIPHHLNCSESLSCDDNINNINNNNNNCEHAINYNIIQTGESGHSISRLILFLYRLLWFIIFDIRSYNNWKLKFSSSVPLKFLEIGQSPLPVQLPSHSMMQKQVQLEPSHVDLPPEGGDESPLPKPKYLELIYHPDDDVESPATVVVQTISQRALDQQQQPSHGNHNNNNLSSAGTIVRDSHTSGYEIPITDLILKATSKMNEHNFNRNNMDCCVVVGDCKTVL